MPPYRRNAYTLSKDAARTEITVLIFMSRLVGVCLLYPPRQRSSDAAAGGHYKSRSKPSSRHATHEQALEPLQPARKAHSSDGCGRIGFSRLRRSRHEASSAGACGACEVPSGEDDGRSRGKAGETGNRAGAEDLYDRLRGQNACADPGGPESAGGEGEGCKAPAPATVAVTAPATVSTIAAPAIASTTPATVPTTPAPATTTPVSSIPDSKNDNSFDEDPEDEGAGDDSDFKDGSASDPLSSQTSPRLTESWAQVSPNPTLFVPYTLTIMSANGLFSFPILSENEIIDMMKQLGIALEIGDLNNPDPKKVVSTFVSLMSISSGTPYEEISVYNKENAKKYGLEGNQHLLSVITVFGPL